MMMEDEFEERTLSVNDIDLSLLRLSSPPYSHSSFFFSDVSPEISPLKRFSPVSDESDHPKRRKLSPQNPIFITSYLETQSSSIDDDPTRNNQKFFAGESPVLESAPCGSSNKTPPDTETVKMVNNCVEEINHGEEETNHAYENQQEEEEEEDCGGEGMRIERSGEGFIIRLKCRCEQAFRVLFSDHHLYFKPL